VVMAWIGQRIEEGAMGSTQLLTHRFWETRSVGTSAD